jgi:Animal haem peroxidase
MSTGSAPARQKVRIAKKNPQVPPSVRRHSDPLRGLSMPLPDSGLFGRMFPLRHGSVSPARFSDAALMKLGAHMSARLDMDPKTEEAQEGGIPALYTYFGQFVGHDLTFDPSSSFQKRKDKKAKDDFRTPALDLDSVYGRGPDDQPYLYRRMPNQKAESMLVGQPLNSGYIGATDLPRNDDDPARALIADPRNDENRIISQLHTLFLNFHNNIATSQGFSFEKVQTEVIYHYQWIVLHDFLPKIIHSKVLQQYKSGDHYERSAIEHFRWRGSRPKPRGVARLSPYPFMPVEFSVAAYRFGHSMVRTSYELNRDVNAAIFPDRMKLFSSDLTGFRRMDPHFGLEWGRFIYLDARRSDKLQGPTNAAPPQLAFKIGTRLANPLSNLPLPSVVSEPPISLAMRNLLRGHQLRLPSAQTVAHAMGIENQLLKDEEIVIEGSSKGGGRSIVEIHKEFKHNCPLWAYILAEATHHQELIPIPGSTKSKWTPKLGPVGGRIVAEVILGLLFADPQSLLGEEGKGWEPNLEDYCLSDFVNDAIDPGRFPKSIRRRAR